MTIRNEQACDMCVSDSGRAGEIMSLADANRLLDTPQPNVFLCPDCRDILERQHRAKNKRK